MNIAMQLDVRYACDHEGAYTPIYGSKSFHNIVAALYAQLLVSMQTKAVISTDQQY